MTPLYDDYVWEENAAAADRDLPQPLDPAMVSLFATAPADDCDVCPECGGPFCAVGDCVCRPRPDDLVFIGAGWASRSAIEQEECSPGYGRTGR